MRSHLALAFAASLLGVGWAAPAHAVAPTSFLGVEEAACLPGGTTMASGGLGFPLASLNLARGLGSGEVRLGVSGVYFPMVGTPSPGVSFGALLWKQVWARWSSVALASVVEGGMVAPLAAGLNPSGRTLVAFPVTWPVGSGVLTVSPRAVLQARLGGGLNLSSDWNAGAQVGYRQPLGGGFTGMAQVAHSVMGYGGGAVGLRWEAHPAFTAELGAGADLNVHSLGSNLSAPDQAFGASFRVSYVWGAGLPQEAQLRAP